MFVVMLWREELLERGVTAKCCGREGMESVTAWPVESDLTIRTTLLEFLGYVMVSREGGDI